MKIKYGYSQKLSVQYLLDFYLSKLKTNKNNCLTGLEYAKKDGLVFENDYPYLGIYKSFEFQKDFVRAKIDDYYSFKNKSEDEIKQILYNFISNSVKFTNNGKITIEIKIIELKNYSDEFFTSDTRNFEDIHSVKKEKINEGNKKYLYWADYSTEKSSTSEDIVSELTDSE